MSRFRFDIRTEGDLQKMMLQEILAAEIAVTKGVDAAGQGLKRDWRAQVRSSGLGSRLANAVRSNTYPKPGVTESINAASLVYAQPNKGLGASAADVLDAHDRGALIRSASGFWLAIPIDPKAQKMRARDLQGRGSHRITPSGWEHRMGRRLELVPRKGRHPLLVDTGIPMARRSTDALDWQDSKYKRWVARGRKRAKTWTPIFVLVPQAKLRKKLTLDEASDRWGDRLAGLIVDNWREVPVGR